MRARRFVVVVAALYLASCAPRARRAEALVDAGWLGEACAVAAPAKEPPRALLDAHLAGEPRVAGGLLGVDALGALMGDRGVGTYGRGWWMGQLIVDEADPAAPSRRLRVDLRRGGMSWPSCDAVACDDAWLARQLELPERAPTQGGLFGAVKAFAGLFAIGGALMFDMAFAPLRVVQAGTGERPLPWLSPQVVDWIGVPAPNAATAAALRLLPTEGGRCSAEAPCADRWIVQETASETGPDLLKLTWTWEHPGCAVEADWELPLSAEGRMVDAVGAGLGDGVRLAELPPVAWRVRVLE